MFAPTRALMARIGTKAGALCASLAEEADVEGSEPTTASIFGRIRAVGAHLENDKMGKNGRCVRHVFFVCVHGHYVGGLGGSKHPSHGPRPCSPRSAPRQPPRLPPKSSASPPPPRGSPSAGRSWRCRHSSGPWILQWRPASRAKLRPPALSWPGRCSWTSAYWAGQLDERF